MMFNLDPRIHFVATKLKSPRDRVLQRNATLAQLYWDMHDSWRFRGPVPKWSGASRDNSQLHGGDLDERPKGGAIGAHIYVSAMPKGYREERRYGEYHKGRLA
jgi:hypothetical protein